MTPDDYARRIEEGTFAETLAVHDSHPGDVFFLPAGRVHAIGAGNLLAEIQESSDITYRIYDYDRRDASGNTRELHTDLAKDAIDFTVRHDYKSSRPADSEVEAELVECDHFTVKRILIDGMRQLTFDDSSFTVMMCVDGELTIECNGVAYTLKKGVSVLIPAIITSFSVKGHATLLIARA